MRFPRRLVAPAILAAGVLVTAVVVIASPPPGPRRAPASPGGPVTTVTPPTAPTPRLPLAAPIIYRDFAFRPADATEPRSGSAGGGRRLWFAAGAWWGALVEPRTGELRIFRLDRPTQSWLDTGAVVDGRANVIVDAVSDGSRVWIATARQGSGADDGVRVAAFTLAAGSDRYRLDPDMPEQATQAGANAISLARDGAGTLWLTALADGNLRIARRASDSGRWSVGPPPAVTGRPEAGRVAAAAIVASGGRTRLLWVRSNESVLLDAVHEDAAPAGFWAVSTVDVPGLGTISGALAATIVDPARPDTLAVAHLAGDGSERSTDAQILLLASRADGEWSRSLVARFKDRLNRPAVTVDAARREVVVAMTSRAGSRSIIAKRASLDRLAFDTGQGEPLIVSGQDPEVDEATTAAGPLGSGAGLVVVASDATTGRYLHATVVPDSLLPPGSRAEAEPEPAVAAGPVTLVDDRNATRGRDLTPFPWVLRPGHEAGRLSIVMDPTAGSVAALETATTSGDVIACRALPETRSGPADIRMAFRVDGRGSSAATVLSLRGHGPRIVDVRVEPTGRLTTLTAGPPVPADVSFERGAWYTLAVSATPGEGRLEVSVTAAGATQASWRTSLAWPPATGRVLDGLCLGTASGASGLEIRFDDLLVVRDAG